MQVSNPSDDHRPISATPCRLRFHLKTAQLKVGRIEIDSRGPVMFVALCAYEFLLLLVLCLSTILL